MEFKVNDRVTVVKPILASQERHIGLTGVIIEDKGPSFNLRYVLKFDTLVDIPVGGNVWSEDELEKEERMDFKVGQKVTVVGQQYEYMDSIGKTGVITEVNLSGKRPYQLDNNWWYNADELKEVEGMLKSELKTGMLVQLTNGQWYITMRNHGCTKETEDILINSDGEFIYLRRYNDDLSYNSNYPDKHSISKIATYDYLHHIFRGQKIDSPEQLDGFKTLWQRENPKKKQLSELVDKLRGQLKEATDKLEAM